MSDPGRQVYPCPECRELIDNVSMHDCRSLAYPQFTSLDSFTIAGRGREIVIREHSGLISPDNPCVHTDLPARLRGDGREGEDR